MNGIATTEATVYIATWQGRTVRRFTKRAAYRSEVARLRAALLAVEWIEGGFVTWCQWCQQAKKFGHAPDCARQLALGLEEVAQ